MAAGFWKSDRRGHEVIAPECFPFRVAAGWNHIERLQGVGHNADSLEALPVEHSNPPSISHASPSVAILPISADGKRSNAWSSAISLNASCNR
jgi:hypothetical protein